MKNKTNTPTQFVMPAVITDFDKWVLKSASEMGIRRLYFLARDGYIMYNAARIIAEKNNLDIELRYLYCSRLSLRTAALSDLGEEAYRYLLEGGFALTPKVILSRLTLSDEERNRVYSDINYSGNEETEMGKAAAAEFCGKLKKSKVYNDYIKSVSQSVKENAVSYLEQEGLLSDTPYAVVDSGWTGSMQRMLRILTKRKQTGFYFGMYSEANREDGDFYTYLFNKNTSPLLVSKFNNHLFEALCSAPHGMTAGYRKEEDKIVPLLKEEKSLNLEHRIIVEQKRLIEDYADKNGVIAKKEYGIKERQKFAFPLLDKLMYNPDKDTAEEYGSLRFSDDPSELYSFPLAEKTGDTKRLYLVPRIMEKLFKKGNLQKPVYWGYATAVLSEKGSFCRLNLRLWEILWLIKRK